MPFPLSWNEYRQKAEQEIAQGAIKEIDFTGNAYQILVFDNDLQKECWVFLELNELDAIKEVICGCEEEESDHTHCWHVTAAYLAIFDNHKKPLNKRFNESFWNIVCEHLCAQLGNNSSCLNRVSDQGWECTSQNRKRTFIIENLSADIYLQLQKMFFQRSKASEETSFVLSQFPHDEIIRWRENRASSVLIYRLSFWYDLAKFLFWEQEKGHYQQISFQYSLEGLPNWITAEFSFLKVGFYISRANLPHIVPSLPALNSSLKVVQKDISKQLSIFYNKITGQLEVSEKKEENIAKVQTGIVLDGWRFIPGEGFYSKVPLEILQTPRIEGKELAETLDTYGSALIPFLPDLTIKMEPTPLSYELFFDEKWDLHLMAYLFEKRDLMKGYSRTIDNWAYLDDEGFYKLADARFKKMETLIPKDKIADFVTQHRSWLSNQEGFRVHIRSIEYQMGYTMDAQNRLQFFKKLENESSKHSIQDFGTWVYMKGQGFFSKSMSSNGFLLKPGLIVPKDQLPLFIKMNSQELALIPGFFLESPPIAYGGLSIGLEGEKSLKISPLYEINSDYESKKITLFEDVVYVEGEGFYILPTSHGLPEEFQQEVILKGEKLENFLQNQWDEIECYITRIDQRVIKPEKMELKAETIEAVPEKGRGWYRFGFLYETEMGSFPFTVLQKAVKKKQRFIFTEGGLVDLQEKRFDWLKRLAKDRLDAKNKTVLLTLLDFIRLNAFDPVGWAPKGDRAQKDLFEEIMRFEPPQKPNISGLNCSLRLYQETGIQWLWFLYHQKLSGLLCDEMGLGKTHQAMALIASVINFFSEVAGGEKCRFLIVCPTSVIHHWEDKIRHFLPDVSVYSFYGIKRNLEDFQKDFDILLTSYGILRNEKKAISAFAFELAIFDEIQMAKNASSGIYTALKSVNAHMKLGLTGTPIENRLRELKSLFDIVLPSYMPGEAEYRDYFIRPIEKENLQSRKEMLNRLVKPFILRRKKMEVLTELPEKIEEIAYCDLSPYQQELYGEVLERQRRHLITELENENNPIPYLHIFSLLSSLKQICDHPAVYLKRPLDYRLYASGKWDLFLELLSEARESGQKVVVFSQYLHMMDIVIAELTEQNIGFATIRGSTRDRKEQIHKFNQDPECEVFVGSLHAAGLGVDLTAGSNVFHIDRWWNKAREDQATDRVHRIGQTRGVQVFKFVTQGTFEERIDEMIAKKGQLMEEVVGADDQAVLKTFTREELFELLKYLDKPEKFGGGTERI